MIGYIYKLTSGIQYYYGSTTTTMEKRLRGNYNNSAKSIIESGNYTYEIVEEIEFDEKIQLHQRERFWIENNECINKNIPSRTKKEYKIDNAEYLLEKRSEWLIQNSDVDKATKKIYYEKNKDVIRGNALKKVSCVCGSNIAHGGMWMHLQSQKHLNYQSGIAVSLS